MKGRRRARRFALQVLYELDQSDHEESFALRYRTAALLASAARGTLGPERAAGAERAAAAWAPGILDAVDAGETPDAEVLRARFPGLGAPSVDADAVLEIFEDYLEQAVYGIRLVRGIRRSLPGLDAAIGRIAPEFPVEQMAPVDRNLLRIALWEIVTDAAPERVAVNEAVELAREFSGESARRMVNGALGAFLGGDRRIEPALYVP